MAIGKRRSISLFLFLWVLFALPSVRSSVNAFPLGLHLEYHINQDVHSAWDEEYFIVRWVPELGENILLLQYSSTKEGIQNETLFVEVDSWSILLENGSYTDSQLQPPLWAESKEWDEGEFVKLLISNESYYVGMAQVHLASGYYSCWRAYTIPRDSMDDDYQIYEENWYFDLVQGVLMKHTEYLPASQFIPYSYSYRRELITSNLSNYGVLSAEEQNELMLRASTWIFLVLCISCVGFTLLYYWHDQKSNRYLS